MQQYVLKVES